MLPGTGKRRRGGGKELTSPSCVFYSSSLQLLLLFAPLPKRGGVRGGEEFWNFSLPHNSKGGRKGEEEEERLTKVSEDRKRDGAGRKDVSI